MKKLFIVTTALLVGSFATAQNSTRTTTTRDAATTRDASSTRDAYSTRDTAAVPAETQTVNETDTTTTTSTTDTRDEDRLSRGGLYLEPMIFGSQEDMSVETGLAGDATGTSRSYGAALRFGGHVSEIFLLGVDGRYAKSNMEGSSYGNADADVYNIAPMVGLQTPLAGIRLTGAYVLAGENNPSGGDAFDVKFKEAQGWRVGAGIHVLAVSVNLEYQDLTYNTTEIESVGPLASATDFDADANTRGYTLSVGFPVEL